MCWHRRILQTPKIAPPAMPRDTIESRCFPNPLAVAEEAPPQGWSPPLSPVQLTHKGTDGAPLLRPEARQTLLDALHFYTTPLLRDTGHTGIVRGASGGQPDTASPGGWCLTRCCSSEVGGNASVYVGRAGIDLALLQLLRQGVGEPVLGPVGDTLWFLPHADRDAPPYPKRPGDCSVLCGAAGTWFVLAMRALIVPCPSVTTPGTPAVSQPSEATEGRKRELVHTFLGFCDYAVKNGDSDEWLYGRAGLLVALLLLWQELQKEQQPLQKQLSASTEDMIDRMAKAILASGVRTATAEGTARGPPLKYRWRGKEFIGAAHGYFGILYVLLLVPSIRRDLTHSAHQKIKETIEWLLHLESEHHNYPAISDEGPRGDYMVHFCHGAPGAVFLLAEAYRVYNNEVYRQAAERAATCVWRWGILRKGPGLCHGVAGNGYALLRWYQVTEQPIWLERAVRFGLEINSQTQRTTYADHPFSLFEGYAGVCCFLSDLLHDPLTARMPLFGV